MKRSQAEKCLEALRVQQLTYIQAMGGSGPKLQSDRDDSDSEYSIVWEEGPYGWVHLFPFGGIDEEFGFEVKDVSDRIPAGILTEVVSSWGLVGLYEN